MRRIIPNIMTLLNLASGFLAIVFTLSQKFQTAAIFMFASFVLDADGFVARIFKAESKIGFQLDSLADVVSFGVAPAVFVYSLFQDITTLIIAACFVLAGAFRLARFNAFTSKVKGFVGMPITMNGLIFPVIYFFNANETFTLIVMMVSIVLMLSNIHFKKVI
ncbi:MAG: CDP-diacylglycerol--serine O-phosphatidyltransferase [archaeon]